MLSPLTTPPFPPMPPLPTPPQHNDEAPYGSGWYLSSYELERGVTVVELDAGDAAFC